MNISIFRHFMTGRRIAALVTVLALLFSVTIETWHLEHPAQVAGFNDLTSVSAFLSGDDASQADPEKSQPGANGSQDCAFHCEQHGRGLPHSVASLDQSMHTAPKLLALRDNGLPVAQPDGLLEPPKA